ncbi:cuticle protein 8-like [Cherax quadricarinatus]|uniref:cuticle protein 8-like n=1 Tax=Cherax quadricarinatus TaxID=27406 RepID=UPI00387ED473
MAPLKVIAILLVVVAFTTAETPTDLFRPIYSSPPYHALPALTPAPYHPPRVYNPEPVYKPAPVYKEVAKPYAFDYGVKDDYTGANFGHSENSDGKAVKGSYSVALPDGRIQTVNYVADEYNGYQAEVTYEGEPIYPEYKPTYQPQPVYKPIPKPYNPPKTVYKPEPVYPTPAPYIPTYHSTPVYPIYL